MRIIFLGTPEFAIPALEKLIAWPSCQVVAVVTQPDRPAGRGKSIFSPPTKLVADRYGIPVFQPEKLAKAKDIVQSMKDLQPDVLVTVAFGQILKKDVLEMAPAGVINVHGSLLPKYRGAAPINWAILKGESTTGITTMFSDPGIDTGAMLLKEELPIGTNMNAEELAESLSYLGANLLIDTLEQLKSGNLKATKQDEAEASYAPRLTKELSNIDWKLPAQEIHNRVRGLLSWPGTHSSFDSQNIKIIKTAICQNVLHEPSLPGTVIKNGDRLLVSCGNNGEERLELIDVKPENKATMSASAWFNGLRSKDNVVLGRS